MEIDPALKPQPLEIARDLAESLAALRTLRWFLQHAERGQSIEAVEAKVAEAGLVLTPKILGLVGGEPPEYVKQKKSNDGLRGRIEALNMHCENLAGVLVRLLEPPPAEKRFQRGPH